MITKKSCSHSSTSTMGGKIIFSARNLSCRQITPSPPMLWIKCSIQKHVDHGIHLKRNSTINSRMRFEILMPKTRSCTTEWKISRPATTTRSILKYMKRNLHLKNKPYLQFIKRGWMKPWTIGWPWQRICPPPYKNGRIKHVDQIESIVKQRLRRSDCLEQDLLQHINLLKTLTHFVQTTPLPHQQKMLEKEEMGLG